MARRNDATFVADIASYKKIFPYIMKKRTESLVYLDITIDLTRTLQFVKEFNKTENNGCDHQLRVFEVIVASIMRTIAIRPYMNRFICRGKHWQRNELSCNFIVKENYTDDAPEHGVLLYMEPEMCLHEMANKINKGIIEATQPAEDVQVDSVIDFVMKLPHWLVSVFIGLIRWFDRIGRAPKILRDMDGLHTSIFIANMGSIGMGPSPKHHLYEWGTTSLFIALGNLKRKRNFNTPDGKPVFLDTMDVSFTIDERICDGFYSMKSIKIFQDILHNPELLLEAPELPGPLKTVKQVRQEKKAVRKTLKQEKKLARRAARRKSAA